uniref:Na_H_Exchanger domain-containing protein n=1 Tax=Macrostomum lignano TaxID=282301 RepID=A0A1I8G048_9PLAT
QSLQQDPELQQLQQPLDQHPVDHEADEEDPDAGAPASGENRPSCCSNQEDAVLIYQAKFRFEDQLGRQTRSDSLKMEAAGHKSMRALRQSIRRHETRAKQRRSSVALRQETVLPVSQPSGLPQPSTQSPSPPSLSPEPPEVDNSCRARCLAAVERCWDRVTRVAWTQRNPLPEDPACWERLRFNLMCPPHGHVARCIAGVLSILVLYGLLFVIVGDHALPRRCIALNSTTAANATLATASFLNDSSATSAEQIEEQLQCSGGNFFGLFVLFVCSMTASSLSKKLNLPPLLGMLIVGCVLGNAPEINVARHISKEYFNKLRELALCTILLRAGLSLDPSTLRRLSATVFRLSFIPCLVESTVGAIAAFFILGFPWEWGFILGFVLGAVSPAVVVLGMLKLEYRGYGVEKGIPTLIIAASSMDDVLAITGFSLALGMASNDGDGSIAGALFRGPRDAFIGIVYGSALGALLWFIPDQKHKRPVMFRFIFLVGGGVIALLGCEKAHVQGAALKQRQPQLSASYCCC